jgi:hypothetical protein
MVLGLFGGNKPTQKNIDKQVNKVKERFAQSDFRRVAMDKLLDWGTAEAYDGLLKRFTIVVQSPHWDEEEKKWLVETLVSHGDVAKQALVRFITTENQVTFACRALARMSTGDDLVAHILAALASRSPEDIRTEQGKKELIHVLDENPDPRVEQGVIPFLSDHSDDVQCAAIDVVKNHKLALGYAPLQKLLYDDLSSARVQRYAASAVHVLELDIDITQALMPAVVEDYLVKDGKLALNRPNA